MAETENKPQPSGRRLGRILLVASLALNLVVLGIVAGTMFSGGSKNTGQRFDLTVGPITRAMAPEQREALRDALRDSGAFERGERNGMRADMNALLSSLRADEFDEDSFRDILTRQRDRLRGAQEKVLDAVAQNVSELSAADRAAFADRLEEQMRRGPPPRQVRQSR